MNSIRGIVPVGPRQWKGARMIRIDALPTLLPAGLQNDLLARCQHENTSLELCLSTVGGDPGEVAVLLILRTVSGYPYEALDRLERVSGMLLQRLTGANVRSHLVEECDWLDRFFTGDIASVSAGVGWFPAEGQANPAQLYVPGRYGAQGATPVDLGKLTTLLSAYPDALLSLQLNPTRLYSGEQKLVRENLTWFSAQAKSPIIQSGTECFSRLDRLSAEPLFMVCLSCVGSEACVRDISSQLRLCGLHSYRLPRLDARGGYALWGNEWISAACIGSAHERYVPRKMLLNLGRLTHLAPLSAVCAAFTLPQRTSDIKGVRINRIAGSREPLPPQLTRKDGIYLGQHFDSGLPLFIPPDDLCRHGFFVGKPGSGKTTFALGMLYRLYNHPNRYPFLAFEPAKTEYRGLLERIPDLRVYTPGNDAVAPIQLNPFLPPKGVRMDQYRQSLEAIFSMAISMDHPLDIILPQVISRCYARYGWRPASTRDSEGARVFGMHEFIREFRDYIHEHYSGDPETEHNLENGGVVRLMALINAPIFDTNRSLDVDELLEHPTVIELDALSNTRHKAMVMGILLTQIMLSVQRKGGSQGRLRNLILVDEAHLLLDQNESDQGARPAQAVVELLQNMTLILRAYGTALLFGDQSPARLTGVILGNVELKMMFRLDSRQDRAILAETALLDEAMTTGMVTLPIGEGYLHCGALSTPIHVVTPDTEKALRLNKALPDARVRQHMNVRLEPPFSQCTTCGSCETCDMGLRADGQFIASRLMDRPEVARCLNAPERQGELAAFLGAPFESAVREVLAQFGMPAADQRMMGCAKAQLIRALLISPQCELTEEALMNPRGTGAGKRQPRTEAFRGGITPYNILERCAVSGDPPDGGYDGETDIAVAEQNGEDGTDG